VGIAGCLTFAGLLVAWSAGAQDEPAEDEELPADLAAEAEPEPAAEAEEEPPGTVGTPPAPAAPEAEPAPAALAPTETGAGPLPDAAGPSTGVEATGAAPGAVDTEATLEAEVDEPKPAIWRNTLFIYENFVSAYTFDRSAELTYNPYYGMSYRFVPRIYLYEGMSLRLDWALEQEITNSDTTTKKNEIWWSDVYVDWVWGGAAKIPGIDVLFTPKVRFTLPASKSSQARTLYTAIGPGFDFLKTFDVLGGITLQYAFRYTKYFNKYTGAISEDPLVECGGSQRTCPYYALGPRNPSHLFSNSFYIDFSPTEKLHIAMQVAVVNRLLYEATSSEVDIMGGSYEVKESSHNTNHQGLMRYIFEIAYDVQPFLSIALGSDTYNPMLAPDSTYYPPFFNRYTNLYLDFVFYPEVLVTNIVTGKKASELEKSLH
jgi:hypothetical protein